jgi:hypothetical protein
MGVDAAALNRRFLNDERLEVPSLDVELPAHAELELGWAAA